MDHPVEVCAEGSDDAADEQDCVGEDECGVPSEVVGHAAEDEGAHDGAEKGHGLRERASPRVVAYPVHLKLGDLLQQHRIIQGVPNDNRHIFLLAQS